MAWRTIYISSKRVRRSIHKWGRVADRAAKQAMVETAMYGMTAVQREINRSKPYKPVATNTYRQSWHWKKTKHGAVLGNPTIQSIFVEVGRDPGKGPPFEAILEWVRVKRLVPKPKQVRVRKPRSYKPAKTPRGRARQMERAALADAKRERAKRFNKVSARLAQIEQENLAWAIVRKIKHRGYPGRYPLLRALPSMARFSKREMRKQLKDAAKRYSPW